MICKFLQAFFFSKVHLFTPARFTNTVLPNFQGQIETSSEKKNIRRAIF